LGTGITPTQIAVTADSAGNLYLTDGTTGDQIQLDSMLNTNWDGSLEYGVAQVQFADGTTWTGQQINALATMGTSGNDTITGTFADEVFDGRGGDDTIVSAGGDNTYIYRPGYGDLSIENASPDAVSEGRLTLATGLSEQNLWFVHNGYDLQIDVLGTRDEISIQGWFGSDASAQLAEIVAGDSMKLDGQIPQLVSAMATYAANNPGFNPATASAMPSNTTLQSALTAAWHH
jgi:hypothetical protein